MLLLVGAHMAYVMRIGGDIYEYRPLDFYWPLLALPAAEGIAHLGARIAAVLRWNRTFVGEGYPYAWAVALFMPVSFYAVAIQGVLLFEGAALRQRINSKHIELNEENAGWLLSVPGMPMLIAISNDLRQPSDEQYVGIRWADHRLFTNEHTPLWQPYEAVRGVIPGDAVTLVGNIGIKPYYVPDLKIVDLYGLTDAVVAHNPVTRPNHERQIAHDRRPPPGYLQQRGVNFHLYPAATSEAEALTGANYALKVGPDLWMPFDVADHQWANERFADHNLRARNRFSLTDPAGNAIAASSAGAMGFRGSRKSTAFAAQRAGDNAARQAMEQGLRTVDVFIKGPGAGREAAIRALQSAGIRVVSIKDVTPAPHNGCRPPKKRRV